MRKKGRLNNEDWNTNLYKKARCKRQSVSTETSEDHEPTERIHEIEPRCDELEKRFTGKHEAANEKAETTERQHRTTTTATQKGEMIGEAEQQLHMTTTKTRREELAGETEQQHTAMTAAQREETIDSKDQELLALIEKRKNMDRKEKAQVKDICKKIKNGIRENKRTSIQEKVQNILRTV